MNYVLNTTLTNGKINIPMYSCLGFFSLLMWRFCFVYSSAIYLNSSYSTNPWLYYVLSSVDLVSAVFFHTAHLFDQSNSKYLPVRVAANLLSYLPNLFPKDYLKFV